MILLLNMAHTSAKMLLPPVLDHRAYQAGCQEIAGSGFVLHFLRFDCQLSTIVSGGESEPPSALVTRNRWPSPLAA